jgi:hypothetical protein
LGLGQIVRSPEIIRKLIERKAPLEMGVAT